MIVHADQRRVKYLTHHVLWSGPNFILSVRSGPKIIHYRLNCYKNNPAWQVLSRLDNTAPSPSQLLRWKFILGERIDKYVRRTISSTEKHQLKATGRFNRKSCRLSHFDLGFNHGTLFGFAGLTCFSSDSSAKDRSI